MNKLVSIIIPCYRGEAYLSMAIESCLSQSYTLFEIIIVDDASPDSCADIAASFVDKDSRCRVITHPENRGVAEAFNTGFNAAQGCYFTRLAQDDIFKPSALEILAQYLDSHLEIDMAYANMEMIDSSGAVTGQFEARPAKEALGTCNGTGVCWMFRSKIWEAGLRFDKRYDQIEDFEFWMRASRHYSIAKLNVSLLQFRRHAEAGTSIYGAKMEIMTGKVIARHSDSLEQKRLSLGEGYFNASYIYRQQGKRLSAIFYGIIALIIQPMQVRCYRNLIAAFLKARHIVRRNT